MLQMLDRIPMRSMRVPMPIALAPLLLYTLMSISALPAGADITPLSQTRSLDFIWSDDEGTYFCLPGCSPVSVVHTEDQGSDQASDFAAWSADLGGIVSLDSTAPGPQGFTASAAHAGSGAAEFYATGDPGGFFAHSRYTISNATVSYTFQVDEPTPFQLQGTVETSGAGFLGSMLARIRLEGPAGQQVAQVELIDDDDCFEVACLELGPETLDVSGTLAPGTYTVEATLYGLADTLISVTSGVAAASDYDGSFQLSLTYPQAVPGLGAPGLMLLAVMLGGTGRRLLSKAAIVG